MKTGQLILFLTFSKLKITSIQVKSSLESFQSMQLQIQTLQKDLKESLQLDNSSPLLSVEEIFPIIKIHEPSSTLLTQLRQIQLIVKADYHYLKNLRAKTFKILYEEDYQSQLSLIQKGFLSFKFTLLQRKIQKTKQKQFIQSLTKNLHESRLRKSQLKIADNYYQTKLLHSILQELSSFIKIKKKSDTLEKRLNQNKSIEFLIHLKQNMKKRKCKKLELEKDEEEINRIFIRKTLQKYFTCFKLFAKFNILERKIKVKALKRFFRQISYIQKQKLSKIQKFQEKQTKKCLHKIFQVLRQNKLQIQCYDWYCYRLQKIYFKKWINFVSVQKNQQQIEAYNEVIVQHFIDSKEVEKSEKIQMKYFTHWKSFAILQKQNKKQTQILKSFAELKQKEYLERKYFQILKSNKNYEKALRFQSQKLKMKTLEGFKKNVILQSQKLQKVYEFIQKRTIKKYFNRIQVFNFYQRNKVKLYRLQSAWSKFTFNITMEYFNKIQKANNYYETLLKFKSLIGLKESVEFNRKTLYCQQKINYIMPIKGWRLRFRLRKLVQKKQSQTLKRILFQWRLITLRKMLSSQKQTNSSQLFIQSRIAEKKRNPKRFSQSSIFLKCKNEISSLSKKQPSFFMAMDQSQSENDDQVEKKVDALLTKIKSKKKLSIKELSVVESQTFTNEKLLFVNKSINKNQAHQTGERLRVPTWNTPDTVYRVSVFSQDMQND